MRYALSIYWAGAVVDAEKCDYDSSKELGLHCPFCREAVFLRVGHQRQVKGETLNISPSFIHYANLGLDCELRSSRPDGQAYINSLQIQSHNQRLLLFNKHFLDILEPVLQISQRSHYIKHLRKMLGRDYLKNLLSYYRNLDLADFSEYIEKIKTYIRDTGENCNIPLVTEIAKDNMSRLSYIKQQNIAIAHEAALWLQSQSASWSLERCMNIVFIQYYIFPMETKLVNITLDLDHSIKTKDKKYPILLGFAKDILGYFEENPNVLCFQLINYLLLVDWQQAYLDFIKTDSSLPAKIPSDVTASEKEYLN